LGAQALSGQSIPGAHGRQAFHRAQGARRKPGSSDWRSPKKLPVTPKACASS